MNCVTAVSMLALLSVLNFWAGKGRILYPPFVFSCLWCIDIAMYYIAPIEIAEVHDSTWLLLVAGALCFSIGGWISGLVPAVVYDFKLRQLQGPAASGFGRALPITVCGIGTVLMLQELRKLAGGWNPVEFLANARKATVETATSTGQAGTHLLGTFAVISVFTVLICLVQSKDKYFWTALAIGTANCILTTGRNYVLMLFTSVCAALLLRERKDDARGLVKLVLVPVLVFVVLFSALPFFTKDVSSFRGDFWGIVSNYTIAYITTPLPALDYAFQHADVFRDAPNHTFQVFAKTLNSVGFSFRTPPMLDTVVWVPLPTNVYTVYKFYFTDFGFGGMLAAIATIGLLQTMVYQRAIRGGRVSLMLCAYLTYPTVFSVFDDAYFPVGFTHLVAAAVIGVLYFAILRRLRLGIQIPAFSLGLRFPVGTSNLKTAAADGPESGIQE